MEPSTAARKTGPPFSPRRVYFGWWIVFSAFTLSALGGGFYFYGFTVFFLPLAEEFDVSRGTLSLVFGLAGLEGALLGPLQGWLVDRYGPRRIMFLGISMMGAGFFLMSYAQSVQMLFVYVILLIAVGSSMGLFSPAFAAVANWFIRKRGTALGIAMSGVGLGAVLVVLTNFLIETMDWRGAARAIAVIILVVGYPLASLMRHRPEQYGMLPDGAEQGPRPTESHGPPQEEIDFTVKEALRTRAFWLISISFALRAFVIAAIGVHFIPVMDDKGLSAATAAALLGLFGVLSVPGRLGFGILGDYLDKRLVVAMTAGLLGLAMLTLIWATSLWQIFIFLVLFALSSGGSAVTFALRGEYFGRGAFATIGGIGSTIMFLGTITGPVFAGFTFDVTESYDVAFLTFTGVSLLSFVAVLLARRPAPPRTRVAPD